MQHPDENGACSTESKLRLADDFETFVPHNAWRKQTDVNWLHIESLPRRLRSCVA